MAKRIGFGSVLNVAPTSTGTQTEIGQIVSISRPGGGATDVDTTTLDSSTNFRTYLRGPVDPGGLNLTLAYDSTLASHAELMTAYNTGDTRRCTVYHGSSTGEPDIFTAYVNDVGEEIPLDDMITCTVSMKVTGDPSYTST